MSDMFLYRVENPNTYQGLWYDKDGNFNPFIKTLTDAKCKDLPMEFDDQFKVGGLAWISACDNMPDMKNWFHHRDVVEMAQAGYGLYQFRVSDYRQVNGHAVFTRSQVLESNLIDIDALK